MLTLTKHYLQTNYPYTNGSTYEGVVEELTQAIEASSISAVTKQIRESCPCPAIVKLADTGKYTFHKCAKKVLLDFEEAYVSKAGYSYGFNGFSRTSTFVNDMHVMVGPDHPVYEGYFLCDWIARGEFCEECGAAYIQEDSNTLCSVCSNMYALLEYNAKAEDILETEETNETLFGIELEYEGITARQVGSHLRDHAISKRDGSVRSGVEIVTRPACVSTHKKSLLPFYENIKVAAKSNTGMHVHVEKKKLSNYQIGFMLEFLNKKELIGHIEKIAGRAYSTNTYCKSAPSMRMSWGNSFNEQTYKIVKRATEKYTPLNTGKDKTIEVRIFSSPESFEEMAAKLDFVAALVKYSSPYAVSVKSLKDKFEWSVFTDFVKMNKREFPHFVSYFLKG